LEDCHGRRVVLGLFAEPFIRLRPGGPTGRCRRRSARAQPRWLGHSMWRRSRLSGTTLGGRPSSGSEVVFGSVVRFVWLSQALIIASRVSDVRLCADNVSMGAYRHHGGIAHASRWLPRHCFVPQPGVMLHLAKTGSPIPLRFAYGGASCPPGQALPAFDTVR
jgi:hypothetical protein